MIYPVKNATIGQRFGEDPATYSQFGMKGHNGQDFPVATGTPVYAPEDGVVYISANNPSDQYTGNPVGGETVVIKGSSGKYEHWLLHNSERLVKQGDRVKEGQLVAYSGNTGFSTGPHCHWGVRPMSPDLNNGYRGFIDPLGVPLTEGDDMPTLVTDDTFTILMGLCQPGTPQDQVDQGRKFWVGKPLEDFVKGLPDAPAVKEYQAGMKDAIALTAAVRKVTVDTLSK